MRKNETRCRSLCRQEQRLRALEDHRKIIMARRSKPGPQIRKGVKLCSAELIIWLYIYKDEWHRNSYHIRRLNIGITEGTLDWIICGGETGPGARPMHPDWVRSLRDQCQAAGVSFFFKQWGEWQNGSAPGNNGSIVLNNGTIIDNVAEITLTKYPRWHSMNPVRMARVGKKKAGRLLDGVTWDEFPEVKQ